MYHYDDDALFVASSLFNSKLIYDVNLIFSALNEFSARTAFYIILAVHEWYAEKHTILICITCIGR